MYTVVVKLFCMIPVLVGYQELRFRNALLIWFENNFYIAPENNRFILAWLNIQLASGRIY